jgi:hypothetical protein
MCVVSLLYVIHPFRAYLTQYFFYIAKPSLMSSTVPVSLSVNKRAAIDDLVVSGMTSHNRWSNGLVVSLMHEIFSYLSGVDLLKRIEPTCRCWYHHSHIGVGWYHLNMDEWVTPETLVRYEWPVIKTNLNSRLTNQLTSFTKNAINININGNGNGNGNHQRWGVRAVSGYIALYDCIDMLGYLDRLQDVSIRIFGVDDGNNPHDEMKRMTDAFTQLTSLLSLRHLITLSLTIELGYAEPYQHLLLESLYLPEMPSLSKLTIDCHRSFKVVGIPSLSRLHTLRIVGDWKPVATRATEPTTEWRLPHLTSLDVSDENYDRRAASLRTLLLTCHHTLRSLTLNHMVNNDDIKVINDINMMALTSLTISSMEISTFSMPLMGCTKLVHVTLPHVSRHYPLSDDQIKLWCGWLSSLLHLQTVSWASAIYGSASRLFWHTFESLPCLTHIDNEPRHDWLNAEKEWYNNPPANRQWWQHSRHMMNLPSRGRGKASGRTIQH